MASGDLAGVLEEAGEEEGGDVFRPSLLQLVAAGELQEGLAGLGDGGQERAQLGELAGAGAMFEGVEVAAGRAGATARPTTPRFFGHR